MPVAYTGDSRCLYDDRDEGNCVWDGNDDPDDDLISGMFVKTALEKSDRRVEIKIMGRRSYGCCMKRYESVNKNFVLICNSKKNEFF